MKLVIVLKHHFLHTWKHKKKEKVKDKYVAKTKFYSLIRIKFGSFYFILKYFINGCRGPPLINLILKTKPLPSSDGSGLVYNKTGCINYKNHKQVAKPKEEWIIVKNTHEPIISQSMFDKVQEILKENHLQYYRFTNIS